MLEVPRSRPFYANSRSLASQVTSGEFLVCCLHHVLGIVCAFVTNVSPTTAARNFVSNAAPAPTHRQMVIR